MNGIPSTEIEFAMLRHQGGAPVPRSAAQRSLQKGLEALARAGGRPPNGPDGRAMLWNEARGWHPGDGDQGTTRRDGPPLAELMARQRFVSHVIRQERLAREVAADEALVRSASPIAWKYARQFRHAFVPQPGLDSPPDMLTGWRLARRGHHSPPAWLLHERRDGSI